MLAFPIFRPKAGLNYPPRAASGGLCGVAAFYASYHGPLEARLPPEVLPELRVAGHLAGRSHFGALRERRIEAARWTRETE